MSMTVTAAEARTRFADILAAAQHHHERVTVTRNGRPVAAVVSVEDLELLQSIEDRVDQEAAAEAIAEAEEHGYVSWSERKARTRR